MAGDFIACYVIEKGLKHFFSDNKPKDIAVRRPDQLKREEERKKVEEKLAQDKKMADAEKKIRDAEEKAMALGAKQVVTAGVRAAGQR